jgi:hypothetical protein
MGEDIQLHDAVALLEEVPTRHFVTNEPVTLRRGQVGTIVMTYNGSAFEVEFADAAGRAYAVLSVDSKKLIPLRYQPALAHA